MRTDLLTCRHNGIQEADLPIMLEKIGVGSVDELIDKTIPTNIRLQEPLPLAAPICQTVAFRKLYSDGCEYFNEPWLYSSTSRNDEFEISSKHLSPFFIYEFVGDFKFLTVEPSVMSFGFIVAFG